MNSTSRSPTRGRLVFVSATLGTGGAERVLTWLANRFAADGRDVTVVRLEASANSPAYSLAPSIELVSLDLQRVSRNAVEGLGANLWRLHALGKALADRSPAHVIAFGMQTNVLTLLAARGRWPVTVSERLHPIFFPAGRIWHMARDWTYPRARQVVFQTGSAQAALPTIRNGAVIPNPVVRRSDPGNAPDPRPYQIVAMGRLTHQKGFDLLIEAVASLPERHRDSRVCVYGQGEAREALCALATARGLSARFEMPGIAADPGRALLDGLIFALPSRFEGFPNALCEAMALGLPCVAADCQSGPGDIVRDGIDGLLVPPDDPPALAGALTRLLDDPALRGRLGREAAALTRRFDEDAIFAQWRDRIG